MWLHPLNIVPKLSPLRQFSRDNILIVHSPECKTMVRCKAGPMNTRSTRGQIGGAQRTKECSLSPQLHSSDIQPWPGLCSVGRGPGEERKNILFFAFLVVLSSSSSCRHLLEGCLVEVITQAFNLLADYYKPDHLPNLSTNCNSQTWDHCPQEQDHC